MKQRGIYGKIMANGQPLKGVTIMVPGSPVARVSNAKGNYYIKVPDHINALKFIYQGKELVKELDPISRKQDLNLKIETEVESNEDWTKEDLFHEAKRVAVDDPSGNESELN